MLAIPLAVMATTLQTKQTYTISGVCKVQDEGVLIIFLVDEETFKKPMTGLKKINHKVVLEKSQTKNISFTFEEIPEGTYGIRCFLDKDGNNQLDRGLFGPSEPWGMSFKEQRVNRIPSFSNISFKLDQSIRNIIIQIK